MYLPCFYGFGSKEFETLDDCLIYCIIACTWVKTFIGSDIPIIGLYTTATQDPSKSSVKEKKNFIWKECNHNLKIDSSEDKVFQILWSKEQSI